jgi:hypothetical protein
MEINEFTAAMTKQEFPGLRILWNRGWTEDNIWKVPTFGN